MIGFIGRALNEEPEYDVERDPRTTKTTEYPAFTLGLVESDSLPRGADRVVSTVDHYYAVPRDRISVQRIARLSLAVTLLTIKRTRTSTSQSRDAFDAARPQLEDYARKIRADVKHHEPALLVLAVETQVQIENVRAERLCVPTFGQAWLRICSPNALYHPLDIRRHIELGPARVERDLSLRRDLP